MQAVVKTSFPCAEFIAVASGALFTNKMIINLLEKNIFANRKKIRILPDLCHKFGINLR